METILGGLLRGVALILFLDQKETTEKKSAIMIKGENYGKEI